MVTGGQYYHTYLPTQDKLDNAFKKKSYELRKKYWTTHNPPYPDWSTSFLLRFFISGDTHVATNFWNHNLTGSRSGSEFVVPLTLLCVLYILIRKPRIFPSLFTIVQKAKKRWWLKIMERTIWACVSTQHCNRVISWRQESIMFLFCQQTLN